VALLGSAEEGNTEAASVGRKSIALTLYSPLEDNIII
jgi:hypothetical protein